MTPPPASTRARLAGSRGSSRRRIQRVSTPGASPTEEGRPPGKTGPEGHQHEEVAVLDAPVHERLVEADRHRGGRRIAVALDIVEHARGGNPVLLGNGLDDPEIGLVEEVEVHRRGLEAVGVERFLYHLTDAAN